MKKEAAKDGKVWPPYTKDRLEYPRGRENKVGRGVSKTLRPQHRDDDNQDYAA